MAAHFVSLVRSSGKKYDPEDHYAMLGISENASIEEIKKAFRREIMKVCRPQTEERSLKELTSSFLSSLPPLAQWHPDMQEQGIGNVAYAEERSKHVIHSYSVLRDPKKRKEYDLQRAAQRNMGTRRSRSPRWPF